MRISDIGRCSSFDAVEGDVRPGHAHLRHVEPGSLREREPSEALEHHLADGLWIELADKEEVHVGRQFEQL
jgi:hypothetical protein